MSGDDRQPDDTVAVAVTAAAVLGGVFALAALALDGPRAALSVLVGATIAVANILAMTAIIRSLLPGAPPDAEEEEPKSEGYPADDERHRARGTRGGLLWGAFAAVKMVILFGGIWLLLTRHVVDPIPLLVGYGTMPLGIVVSAVWPSLKRRG